MSRSVSGTREAFDSHAAPASAAGFEPLSVQDQMFLACESPTTPMHVGVVLLVEKGLPTRRGALDISAVRSHIGSRLDAMPRYRKKVAYTPLRKSPLWMADRGFDLQYHVRQHALPNPRTEQTLRTLCGDLLAQPLNPSKPLWEIHLIEGVKGGRTAVLAKAHHCLVDGVRGAHVLELLLDAFPNALAPAVIERRPLRAVPRRPGPHLGREIRGTELLREDLDGLWSSLAGAAGRVQDLMRQPRDTVLRAIDAATDLSEVLRAGLEKTPATPLNGPNSAARRFDWVEMPLDHIKAIKNRLGGTVNDVVLAIVTGALRRFFIHQRDVRWPKDLRVMVPVNRLTADQGLTCGNFIGGVMLKLPVSAADPQWRYRVVCNRTAAAKQSRQAAGAELLTNAGSALLGVGLELIDWLRPFNLVVSNIPGPQVPLYFAGAPLASLHPSVPLFNGQGASVALFSYAGKLCWGINADPAVVPDVAHFTRALSASFEELRQVCGLVAPEAAELAPVGLTPAVSSEVPLAALA